MSDPCIELVPVKSSPTVRRGGSFALDAASYVQLIYNNPGEMVLTMTLHSDRPMAEIEDKVAEIGRLMRECRLRTCCHPAYIIGSD